MAAAALLSITLIPVLMGWLIRGKIPSEDANPINRFLTRIYRPALDWVLAKPKAALLIAWLVFATSLWPISQTGGEFMPQMNEGDLALHALGAAGDFDGEGVDAAPADRPADQDRARGRKRVRQGRPRRHARPIPPRSKCSRPRSASNPRANGERA
jgi:hypothetical protein